MKRAQSACDKQYRSHSPRITNTQAFVAVGQQEKYLAKAGVEAVKRALHHALLMEFAAAIIVVCAITIIITICFAFVAPIIKMILDWIAYKSRNTAFEANDLVVVLPNPTALASTEVWLKENATELPPPSYNEVMSSGTK
uniref:Uncharacterized protein n=1 Tax=Plectus sambesii TaxID=2011161 RepID=A0A914W0Q4_9BILA